MQIRPLTTDDMPQVIKLHQYAYGYWTDQAVQEEEYHHLIPEDSWGVFDNGKLQSVLTIMKARQAIRGVLKPMGGLHMVGSYPEVRMKGYIRTLMERAFTDMHASEIAVSMLEPFRETFYARFGYVSANDKFRLTAPLEGLRVPKKAEIGDDWTFDRVVGSEAKDSYLQFIQDHALSKYHGYAFNPTISDAEWNYRNKNRHFVFIKHQGKIQALARYQIKGFMHFKEEGQLIIDEMYWHTLNGQAALFHFLGTHRDQVKKIHLRLPYGTHFQHWFVDLLDWIEIKVWNPWMVRLIEIKNALTGLPAPLEGEFTFTLKDTHCSWNDGTYVLRSDGERLQIEPTSMTPTLKLTIEGLSALIYGTNTTDTLEFQGWIKGLDDQTRMLLQHWFPPVLLYNPYEF